jgi:hypothetical protein
MRSRTVLVLLALAACGDEDRTQTEYTPANDYTRTSADDQPSVPAPATAVPDTTPVPAPPQGRVAIALAPLGHSTVRGTGEVAAAGKATSISVTLTEGVRGATYEGAVRQGRCNAMGASVASLVPVTADSAMRRGQAASDVNVPIDSLTGAPHVVVYGRGGRPEACASIGGPPAIPPAAPAPPPLRPVRPPPDTSGRRVG